MKAHLQFVLLASAGLMIPAAWQPQAVAQDAPPEQEAAEAAEQASRVEGPAMRELDQGPPEHLTYRPDEIDWRDGPGSFEPGAQFAVLEGDPGTSGVFTMQIRMPDGFVINPHWHPNVERVTVLKGIFHLGAGETVDRSAAERLPAGSYTAMPARMVHHAIAEGETIVQLTTVGPWEINYVNPAHDPRKRE